MAKVPRATVAERALKRAIEEETAQIQIDLQAAEQEIGRLKGLLGQIAQMAGEVAMVVHYTAEPVVRPAAPPLESLPPELQAHLKRPVPEPEPAMTLPLADDDDMGEGTWL